MAKRWKELQKSIPWAAWVRACKDYVPNGNLPLTLRTILGVLVIQHIDLLTEEQVGKLMTEHPCYRDFAKAKTTTMAPEQWTKDWQTCQRRIGEPNWTSLRDWVDRTLPTIKVVTQVEKPGMNGKDGAPAEHTKPIQLTPREFEILELMAEGATALDIAGHLFIAENTVRTHRRNIRRKLGITDVSARRVLLYKEWLERLRGRFN